MEIIEEHKFTDFFEKSEEKQRKIDFLVFHHIEADNVDVALGLLKEHKVSSHYLIDEEGQVISLVDENDIAYHAGVSYFAGHEGLNKNSIGIELLNKDVNHSEFPKAQLDSLIDLSKNLIDKYQIEQKNIVGHSDIGYFSDECDGEFVDQKGCLDRKDDPSHMFDWKYMSQNGVSLFPEEDFTGDDEILFEFGDSGDEIKYIKQKLADFGYKVKEFDEEFYTEMRNLARVFNRRFNPKAYLADKDVWWKSSSELLSKLKS